MNIKNVLDWFIPDSIKDDIVKKGQTKITIIIMFAASALLLPNTMRGWRTGRLDFILFPIVESILIFLGPFIIKKTKSQLIGANYFLVLFTIMVTYFTVLRGGISSYFAMNYVVIVLFAFLATELLWGFIWSAISIAIGVILKIMETNGFPFNEVSAANAHINFINIVIVAMILSAINKKNATNNLKSFSEEKSNSEKSADTLREVLNETNEVMSDVSNGDLSNTIDVEVGGDLSSLKTSVNNALKLLGDALSQVVLTSHEINKGTAEISSAAQSLAGGSTEQAASIEEISSSMNEIGAKAKANDENATQAQSLSNQAVTDLKKGNVQMNKMLEAMNTISETSANVSKVVKVIDEIAFQTNLLALNAAVEAARAGKYGKGFAVVAEEVRNLATRSSEAAKDTTELIESSIKNVENGVESANITANTLKSFVETINKVNEYVGKISAASKEQTLNVNEINNGLRQVNDVVQQNSSISEESASASEELSSQAELLQNLMNRFKLAKTQTPKPPAKPHEQLPKKATVFTLPTPPTSQPIAQKGRRKIVLDDGDFGKY